MRLAGSQVHGRHARAARCLVAGSRTHFRPSPPTVPLGQARRPRAARVVALHHRVRHARVQAATARRNRRLICGASQRGLLRAPAAHHGGRRARRPQVPGRHPCRLRALRAAPLRRLPRNQWLTRAARPRRLRPRCTTRRPCRRASCAAASATRCCSSGGTAPSTSSRPRRAAAAQRAADAEVARRRRLPPRGSGTMSTRGCSRRGRPLLAPARRTRSTTCSRSSTRRAHRAARRRHRRAVCERRKRGAAAASPWTM